MNVRLKMFPYRYMEYELNMMKREILTLFPSATIVEDANTILLSGINENDLQKLYCLTFISEYEVEGIIHETYQSLIEREDGTSNSRQHTRYSTHGIHEYKGKYNPQIVHCMINLFGLDSGDVVLDPFNGSGTTTLECAHLGIRALGADINPMACFIANAKLRALEIDTETAADNLDCLRKHLDRESSVLSLSDDPRMTYLKKWIPDENLRVFEIIRNYAETQNEPLKLLLLAMASDLIRDYSYQEPKDLRIRRRITPFPSIPLAEEYYHRIVKTVERIAHVQATVGQIHTNNNANCCDIRIDCPNNDTPFSAVLTSPPYVTALPYIDTQRISLVWLNLCDASEIGTLESSLIGSREMRNGQKNYWGARAEDNSEGIPDMLWSLVLQMQESIGPNDGFRKRAVPTLFYRYLADMKKAFTNISRHVNHNAPFALIVGHNKATLGNRQFLLNTPDYLAKTAQECGWELEEIVPLETYKRYGINSKNAINRESMVILRRQ